VGSSARSADHEVDPAAAAPPVPGPATSTSRPRAPVQSDPPPRPGGAPEGVTLSEQRGAGLSLSEYQATQDEKCLEAQLDAGCVTIRYPAGTDADACTVGDDFSVTPGVFDPENRTVPVGSTVVVVCRPLEPVDNPVEGGG